MRAPIVSLHCVVSAVVTPFENTVSVPENVAVPVKVGDALGAYEVRLGGVNLTTFESRLIAPPTMVLSTSLVKVRLFSFVLSWVCTAAVVPDRYPSSAEVTEPMLVETGSVHEDDTTTSEHGFSVVPRRCGTSVPHTRLEPKFIGVLK